MPSLKCRFGPRQPMSESNTQASTIDGRRLTGPRAWGSLSEKSKLAIPCLIVTVTASFTGLSTTTPSLSSSPAAEDSPSGNLVMATRNSSAAPLRVAAKASMTARAPKRSHNCLTRTAPICVTAIWAWMSPRTSAGRRLLVRMMRSTSVCATPASTILIGGTGRGRAGDRPADVRLVRDRTRKRDDPAIREDRRDEGHVGDVGQAALVGMIGDEDVAVLDRPIAAIELEDAADEMAIDRRVEEHRRRHDQASLAVEDHTAEVARLADDGRVAGAVEMVVHFIDQARDLVAQDLDGDGVHAQALVRIRLP